MPRGVCVRVRVRVLSYSQTFNGGLSFTVAAPAAVSGRANALNMIFLGQGAVHACSGGQQEAGGGRAGGGWRASRYR